MDVEGNLRTFISKNPEEGGGLVLAEESILYKEKRDNWGLVAN